VPGGPKNYAFKTMKAETLETKTVCKVRGIKLNYVTAQLVNCNSIRTMILGADAGDVITVRTDRKIKRKIRRCDGSGADTIMIVSELQEKVCRVSFYNRRSLDDHDFVAFGYMKKEQGVSVSQYVS
jgi:hypothetical protein